VDSAWRRQSLKGVAAWCAVGPDPVSNIKVFTHVYATSSTVVEARVVLQALRCARLQGFRRVEILTLSLLEVVHAL